jgi:uncharacterized protein (TIGR00255 family)
MIKSMTGFASASREDELSSVTVTVRAVNHRFLDLQLRLPPAAAAAEPRLRALVQRLMARGRVEVSVTLQLRLTPVVEVTLNEPFTAALSAALETARERGLISGALSPGDLLRFPQALAIAERLPDADDSRTARLHEAIEEVATRALAELDAMRIREGGYLRADVEDRRELLAQLIARIVAAAEAGRGAIEARLAARVRELSLDAPPDPAAVAQEIVRFAARSDISEEVVRFRGHLAHWRTLADSAEPCGRKLDFLLQEMNREINTIGSKAEGADVPALIVTTKAELERMREQAQNVE